MLFRLACVESSKAFVNVLKKKSCGASPHKGETVLSEDDLKEFRTRLLMIHRVV